MGRLSRAGLVVHDDHAAERRTAADGHDVLRHRHARARRDVRVARARLARLNRPAPQFSACATFKARVCDPPAAPSPAQPQDGATGQPAVVNFAWIGAPGATSYDVRTCTDPGQAFISAGTTTGTSLNATFRPGAQVEWYVDALNGTCTTSSTHRSFTTAACSTVAPTPSAPIGTVTAGAPIVFRWSAVGGAKRYDLFLTPVNGDIVSLEETSETTFTAHRPAGTYDWFVEGHPRRLPAGALRDQPLRRAAGAALHDCAADAADARQRRNHRSPSHRLPSTWSAIPNAARYEVWTSLNDGVFVRIAETSAPALSTDFAPGHVRWYVVALRDGSNHLPSTSSSFDVSRPIACAPNTAPSPSRLAHAAEQLPSTVDFFWTNVAGAQDYKLWVGVDDGPATVLATTTGLRAQATVPRGRIRWFVEATFGACGTRRSAEASFRSNASGSCSVPAAPPLAVPASVASGVTYDVHWSAQPNVGSYEVLESTDATAATPNIIKTSDVTLSRQHNVTVPTRYRHPCAGSVTAAPAPARFPPRPRCSLRRPGRVEPFGSALLLQTLFVPGGSTAVPFTATSDLPAHHHPVERHPAAGRRTLSCARRLATAQPTSASIRQHPVSRATPRPPRRPSPSHSSLRSRRAARAPRRPMR